VQHVVERRWFLYQQPHAPSRILHDQPTGVFDAAAPGLFEEYFVIHSDRAEYTRCPGQANEIRVEDGEASFQLRRAVVL